MSKKGKARCKEGQEEDEGKIRRQDRRRRRWQRTIGVEEKKGNVAHKLWHKETHYWTLHTPPCNVKQDMMRRTGAWFCPQLQVRLTSFPSGREQGVDAVTSALTRDHFSRTLFGGTVGSSQCCFRPVSTAGIGYVSLLSLSCLVCTLLLRCLQLAGCFS